MVSKTGTRAKFQQKLFNLMVVGARQSFHFFLQNTWFVENNRALTTFWYGILHYLIGIINLKQNQSIKPNFILTTEATFNSNYITHVFEFAVSTSN